MYREVYSGYLRLLGAEHENTIILATNYADSLVALEGFEEAKSLLRGLIPMVRRVLGENHEETLRLRWSHAMTLYLDRGATLDDLREAVTTLEDATRIMRLVFGRAHPTTARIEGELREARAALRARESGAVESIREGVAAMTARDA